MILTGKNILLTNIWLKNYAGSELNCLDISIALRDMGANVEIATFEYDHPMRKEYEKNHLNVKVARKEELDRKHYDLIWAHHTIVLDYLLFEKGITADRVIFSSLSTLEPYEVPPPYANELSLCLAVSEGAGEQAISEGVEKGQCIVFPNYVSEEFYAKGETRLPPPKLERVAVISNHVPEEVRDALTLLSKRGVRTDIYGIQDKFEKITAEILLQYDTVITIGRTVQYAMALNIPVFVYDHFGGYGYLSEKNLNIVKHYTMSGRGGEKKSAETIAAELQQRYDDACKELPYLREYINENCILEKNIEKVLQIVDEKQPVDIEDLVKKYAVRKRENQALVRLFIEYTKLERKYKKLTSFSSWKITKPLRSIAATAKRLLKSKEM